MDYQPAAAAPEHRGGGLPPASSDRLPDGSPPDDHLPDEPDRSLLSDLEAAWVDGKTYVAAELAFQKTRARYTTTKLKRVVVYGVAAIFVAVLALIGLTVGAIISLATLTGPLAATLIVVGVLLIVAFILVRRAAAGWNAVTSAFSSDEAPQ
jgi:hypothetical protein